VLFLSLIFCKQEEKLLFFGNVSGCTCLILQTQRPMVKDFKKNPPDESILWNKHDVIMNVKWSLLPKQIVQLSQCQNSSIAYILILCGTHTAFWNSFGTIYIVLFFLKKQSRDRILETYIICKKPDIVLTCRILMYTWSVSSFRYISFRHFVPYSDFPFSIAWLYINVLYYPRSPRGFRLCSVWT
jgi:hypothetical protein